MSVGIYPFLQFTRVNKERRKFQAKKKKKKKKQTKKPPPPPLPENTSTLPTLNSIFK